MGTILDHVTDTTYKYILRMPKAERKVYGQFFTSRETAMFMASLFTIPSGKEEISILDPGSGSGILSAALIERLQAIDDLQKIYLTCYETDINIIDLLKENLEWICQQSIIKIEYCIVFDNFICSQSLEYNHLIGANPDPIKYDIVIGNPPYRKIAKGAPEAVSMPNICYGAPNLYFLFAAMSLFDLKEHGELVYIIPRSWTSGAYFAKFRQEFLSAAVIKHLHLFISRDKVFEKESVLQEAIIIKIEKTNIKPKEIHITTTQTNQDFSEKTEFDAPYEIVVSGKEAFVYLVTNKEDMLTLHRLNQLGDTLPSIGLRMKTGLTVDFRNRDALRNAEEDDAVPLFFAQHIQNGQVVFPIGKEHEYLATEKAGLLQHNANYLFVKRFTAKEEHRRLQCGVYLARQNPKYAKISTQNKINFICGMQELSECIVYGLYVLFNSTLYDCYYRILNGSTQVNSTEINSMPVPPMSVIEEMGKELIMVKDMSEASCDNILGRYI